MAETICAAVLKLSQSNNDLLGFEKNSNLYFSVLYVDTERNLKERLPYALQQIQLKAGYTILDHPANFDYISLLPIERTQRFETLNEYLRHLRQGITDQHLFVILDVATDCVPDFNRVDCSMQLIDMMNIAINTYDVTFLCIIHENPNSEKARGHLGTEILNKATTAWSIAFEKDARHNETEIIKVKCLKSGVMKKPEPYFIKYSEDARGLVPASTDEIQQLVIEHTRKADYDAVCNSLKIHLDGKLMNNAELTEKICEELHCSDKTLWDRLKHIEENKIEIFNSNKEACVLKKYKGKKVLWELVPIPSS